MRWSGEMLNVWKSEDLRFWRKGNRRMCLKKCGDLRFSEWGKGHVETCTCASLHKYSGVGNADKITFVLFNRGKLVSLYLLLRSPAKTLYSSRLLFVRRRSFNIIVFNLLPSGKWSSISIIHACILKILGRWWRIIRSQFRRLHTSFVFT